MLKIFLACGAAWMIFIIMSYVINHQDTFYLFIGFIIGVGVSSLAWVRYLHKK
jgi:hypothetical protein